MHRIFIAINLPENIKSDLIAFQKKWSQIPCRWTKKENLHLTLVFLGYLKDEQLLEVFKQVREIALKNKPFSIYFKKICYGPKDKKIPRMIWVEGEKSTELAKLQRELENLFENKISNFKKEKRAFVPHITLARIRQWDFRKMEPEEIPEINEEISLMVEVNSIEIMESKLKPQGPDYFVLESVPLGNSF